MYMAIRLVKSNERWPFTSEKKGFLCDEGPTLETLDFTIRIGSTPTFSYFDLNLYSAYAAHDVVSERVFSESVFVKHFPWYIFLIFAILNL